MSERSQRRSGEPGWLGTAGGALLLVVVGFAVGLLAGTAFEAPDLVMDQLAGRGERVAVEEVDLSAAGSLPSVSMPTVDAGPPDFAGTAQSDPPRTDGRAGRGSGAGPEPVAPAPRPGSGPGGAGYSIQVGAFADAVSARSLATTLRGHDLPGHVVGDGGSPWRVRVGPYPTESEARQVADRLRADHELPTWVVRVEGS